MRWLTGIFLATVLFAASSYALFRISVPDYRGTVQLEDLTNATEVTFDRYAIPTITASNTHDLYKTLGYLHARERLWQMEFGRRVVQGRVSEIMGAGTLGLDRFTRTLGLHRAAAASMDDISGETLEALEAYTSGVNQYIDQTAILPPEFWILWHKPEPWTPLDSLAWTKLLALDLAENWRTEWLRFRIDRSLGGEILDELWPAIDPNVPVSIRGDDLSGFSGPSWLANDRHKGSNAWAINGRHTESGYPILANDPHLAMRAPTLWYLARFKTPEFEAIGATIPGMPVMVLGRNHDVAWGFTNTGSDQQDLFVEALDQLNTDDLEHRDEVIDVRFGSSHDISIRSTPRGPILSDVLFGAEGFLNGGEALSLSWTALRDGDKTIQTGIELVQARNASDILNAVCHFKAPQQNVTFATRDGDVGMIAAGWVPKREAGSGWKPDDAQFAKQSWHSMIAFEELPAAINPGSNHVMNANNPIVDRAYDHDLGRDWDSGMRARRLDDLLSAAGLASLESTKAMQNDQHSTLAKDMLPFLLRSIRAQPGLESYVQLLSEWNFESDTKSAAMLLFAGWYDQLAEDLYADELGPLFQSFRGVRSSFTHHTLSGGNDWCDDRKTLGVESCDTISKRAFVIALSDLQRTYGNNVNQWRWGDAHRFRPLHAPLSQIPFAARLFSIDLQAGGDSSSVNVAHYRRNSSNRFDISQGPGYRGIYDLGEPNAALLITAGGQSGHPLSAHYEDLARLWRDGEYIDMRKQKLTDNRTMRFLPASR